MVLYHSIVSFHVFGVKIQASRIIKLRFIDFVSLKMAESQISCDLNLRSFQISKLFLNLLEPSYSLVAMFLNH